MTIGPGAAALTALDDGQLAVSLAEQAGLRLLEVRADGADTTSAELKAAGDQASHLLLVAALAEARPDDAVLSEEGVDDPVRLTSRRVWIVDPLDGTREFSEPPRDDWAVHVALWEDGVLVAGAVGLPGMDRVFSTALPTSLPPVGDRPLRVVVSRTRPPAESTRVAAAIGAELLAMGSAGAKAMAVVRGEADVYVHSGGQYEWDSAAPVAVATAAGLHCSRIDGTPLVYNRRDAYLPDLLICRPELAARVLDVLMTDAVQTTEHL